MCLPKTQLTSVTRSAFYRQRTLAGRTESISYGERSWSAQCSVTERLLQRAGAARQYEIPAEEGGVENGSQDPGH